jgi:hypothetical protein
VISQGVEVVMPTKLSSKVQEEMIAFPVIGPVRRMPIC